MRSANVAVIGTTSLPRCSNCGGSPILVKKEQLCSGCYWRKHRHGDFSYRRLPKGCTALERFEFYTVRAVDPFDCWLWCGTTVSNKAQRNYGLLWDGTRQVLAHRWSYEYFREVTIPVGLVLDHFICETPQCVHPYHTQPVTQAVNIARGRRHRK